MSLSLNMASPGGREVLDDLRARGLLHQMTSPALAELEQVTTGWLRDAMAGTWTQVGEKSGAHYVTYRNAIGDFVKSIKEDTVIFSHFIAINAVIGVATQNDAVLVTSLDNCSVTTFEVHADGRLELIEAGNEADTLIR